MKVGADLGYRPRRGSGKPIGPAAHGAIDYAFAAAHALAPTLLGLTGPAKTLCYGFAGATLGINALTNHPLGVVRVIPFRRHGELETPFFPAIAALPWLTGAAAQSRARWYFAAYFVLGAANYLLTDYAADEQTAPPLAGQRMVSAHR